MAISFGGISSLNVSSYTVGAGSNALLIALIAQTAGQVTALKYNGVAMTQIANFTWSSGGNDFQIYAMSAPPQGSSYNFTIQDGSSANVRYAAHYFGASQVYSTYQHNAATGSSDSLSITPDTSTSWVFSVTANVSGGTITPSATGLTSRASGNIGTWYDSNGPESSLYTITYSMGSSYSYAIAELLISPHVDNTLTGAYGTLTLTGINATLTQGIAHFLTGATGILTLTGIAGALTYFQLWKNQAKDSSSFTNASKDASSWTNKTPDSSSWTNQTKDL